METIFKIWWSFFHSKVAKRAMINFWEMYRRYSRTEREPLALVWPCHVYLYGKHFELETNRLKWSFQVNLSPLREMNDGCYDFSHMSSHWRIVQAHRTYSWCFVSLTQEVSNEDKSVAEYIRYVAENAPPEPYLSRKLKKHLLKMMKLQC